MGAWISRGNFISLLYKACAVSLYTILVRKIGGHFVTLFFNMSQNDLKCQNCILLIFSAIHITTIAFRSATPNSILIDKRAAVTESMNKLDNEFLEKINKLIEDRLSSEKIDIGYLSDAMCMSNSTLYRKMKALTGLSTNEYIRKIKMQYAERLLLEGKYNISEVAFKVGINSTVYFRQCFKDEFGMAPSDYLKKIKPE